MYTTRTFASHQHRCINAYRANSDSYCCFNLLTSDTLLDKVEDLLPEHRERLYPPIDQIDIMFSLEAAQLVFLRWVQGHHMLFLAGVYINNADKSRLRFRWVMAPTNDELTHLTHTIAHRVARCLERQGLLERDAGHTYFTLTHNGRVRYALKTPWRNGTTQVICEPLDCISRLLALVPKPRVNLTRFHGVFAPQ